MLRIRDYIDGQGGEAAEAFVAWFGIGRSSLAPALVAPSEEPRALVFRFAGFTDAVEGRLLETAKGVSLRVALVSPHDVLRVLFDAVASASDPDLPRQLFEPFADWVETELAGCDRFVLWTQPAPFYALDANGELESEPSGMATSFRATLLRPTDDPVAAILHETAELDAYEVVSIRASPAAP